MTTYFKVLFKTLVFSALFLIVFNPASIGLAASKKTVITLSHADEWDTFLLNAIKLFNKSQPDLEVKVENYFKSGEFEKQLDYGSQLTTKLMAGKGPDIIDVTHLPYHRLANRGVLAELDRVIHKDRSFVPDDYFQNILNAGRIGGRLYTMPTSFLLRVFAGDQDILTAQGFKLQSNATWEEFVNELIKLKKNLNQNGLTDRYPLARIDLPLEMIDINDFVDWNAKKASFQSARFLKLLKLCRKAAAVRLEHPDVDDCQKEEALKRGAIVFWDNFSIADYFDLNIAKNIFQKNRLLLVPYPSGDGRGNAFDYVSLYAINSRSKQKQQAWHFIKFLVTYKSQLDSYVYGFPINKKASKKRLLTMVQQAAKGNLCGVSGSGQPLAVKPPTKEEIKAIDNLIASLNRCIYSDRQLKQIVNTELKKFLAGERSAQETARVIQSKAEIYLWE